MQHKANSICKIPQER